MPDLSAGTTVLAQDTPPTVQADEPTDLTGLSGTSYAAGTPECGTTFIAPTTGRIKVHVYGRLGSNGTNRTYLSVQVYEGTDDSGVIVQDGDDNNSVSEQGSVSFQGKGMDVVVSGLTPGATHFARTVHRVSGGSDGAVYHRRIIVAPAT
jgi:hypothetical protein